MERGCQQLSVAELTQQYTITQLALVCYDLTAINLIVNYWTTSLNNAIMIVVCLALLAVLNLWSVRWYGETEFWIVSGMLICVLLIAANHYSR